MWRGVVVWVTPALCHVLTESSSPFSDELTAITPPSARVTPEQDSAAETSSQTTTTTTGPVDKPGKNAGQPVSATTPQSTNTSTTSVITTPKTSNQPNKTTRYGRNRNRTTIQTSRTGKKRTPCAFCLTVVAECPSSFDYKWKYLCSCDSFTGRIWKWLQRGKETEKLFHEKQGGSCVG